MNEKKLMKIYFDVNRTSNHSIIPDVKKNNTFQHKIKNILISNTVILLLFVSSLTGIIKYHGNNKTPIKYETAVSTVNYISTNFTIGVNYLLENNYIVRR